MRKASPWLHSRDALGAGTLLGPSAARLLLRCKREQAGLLSCCVRLSRAPCGRRPGAANMARAAIAALLLALACLASAQTQTSTPTYVLDTLQPQTVRPAELARQLPV